MQANILVTDAGRACLADFGLSSVSISEIIETSRLSALRTGGTLRWMSPEILNETQPPNRKSDMYSFACICYEVGGLAPES